MWPFKKKESVNCLKCGKEIDPNDAAQMRYKYVEDGEAKIGTAFLCHPCAEELEQEDPTIDEAL